MPAGATSKREQEYKQLQKQFKQEGRYKGREEEVASRIVNKQRAALGETRRAKEMDKAGKSPDRNLPIADFDTMTIPQIRMKLDGLGRRELKKLRTFEVRNKNRKGVLAELDRRLNNS
jgi:hypothetical protein